MTAAYGAGKTDRSVAFALGPYERATGLGLKSAVLVTLDDRACPDVGTLTASRGGPTDGIGAGAVQAADDASDQRLCGLGPSQVATPTALTKAWWACEEKAYTSLTLEGTVGRLTYPAAGSQEEQAVDVPREAGGPVVPHAALAGHVRS